MSISAIGAIAGENYLRGVQEADANGMVTFLTYVATLTVGVSAWTGTGAVGAGD